MTTTISRSHARWQHRGARLRVIGRGLLTCAAAIFLAVSAGPVDAQAGPAPAPAKGIFETEDPTSFVAIALASGSLDDAEGPVDWPTYLARYEHVKKTLAGTLVGTIVGAGMVFLYCGPVENDESEDFLGETSCINRDRWFGFVAGGSLIGTVLGGARGASITGGRLGPISPLRISNCTFRDGLRRSLIGAAIGSLPAVAMFAGGSDALSSSLVAPLFQGTGALIATWSCFGEPRLGPIGQPPVR